MEGCFDCSTSMLYPDGALRCELDNHLAVEHCIWYSKGSPEIYKIRLEKPETTAEKAKPMKVKQVKSIANKKKVKPMQKRLI